MQLTFETELNQHFFRFKVHVNLWGNVSNIYVVLCLASMIV